MLTHLLEAEAGRHPAETARVPRPGGRSPMTLFLLDDAASSEDPLVAEGAA